MSIVNKGDTHYLMNVFLDKDVSPLMGWSISHGLPFAFDNRFNFTDDPSKADIVPLLYRWSDEERNEQTRYFKTLFKTTKPVIVLDLFHDTESDSTNRFLDYKQIYKNSLIVSTYFNTPNKRAVFYDFLWNRTKGAYNFGYMDKEFLKHSTWLLNLDLNIFTLTYSKNITNIIMCPNRAYYGKLDTDGRLFYRTLLHKFFENDVNVLLSDPDNNRILQTANWKDEYQGTLADGGRYAPIDPELYNKSLVSVYVESVAVNTFNKSITEKTWEPLLKGHFILPFAAQGIIFELRKRGFLFPNFIDYTYDTFVDDNERWKGFVKELEKLQKLSIEQATNLYENNKHIIEHNIELFRTIPYDSLYDTICQNHLTFS